jgi:hypothetical protein
MDAVQAIVEMQKAFGNQASHPWLFTGEALNTFTTREVKNILSEVKEMQKAQVANDRDGVRDGLCDIIVYAVGALHKMGFNPNEDVQAVVDALYTRVIRDEAHLQQSLKFYQDQGVHVTIHGEFPRKFLRSAKDQELGHDALPEGKFLKAYGHQQPQFRNYTAPPIGTVDVAPPIPRSFMSAQKPVSDAQAVQADTSQMRAKAMQREADWLALVNKTVGDLKVMLDACTDEQRDSLLSGRHVIEHRVTKYIVA